MFELFFIFVGSVAFGLWQGSVWAGIAVFCFGSVFRITIMDLARKINE